MSEYPLKKQVITQPQAVQLAGLLRDDAPGSVWGWVKYEHRNDYVLELTPGGMHDNLADYYYHAYTGDELGALLLNSLPGGWFGKNTMPPLVSGRARTAIDGLERGFITKEDFKYE
jgi:hypothetical protein